MGGFGGIVGSGALGSSFGGTRGLGFGTAQRPEDTSDLPGISPTLEADSDVYGLWYPGINTVTSGGDVTEMGAYFSGRVTAFSNMKWVDSGGASPALGTDGNGNNFLDPDGATEDLHGNAALLNGSGGGGFMRNKAAGTGVSMICVMVGDEQDSTAVALNNATVASNNDIRFRYIRSNTATRHFGEHTHPDQHTPENEIRFDFNNSPLSGLKVVCVSLAQDGTASNGLLYEENGSTSTSATFNMQDGTGDNNTAHSDTDLDNAQLLSTAGGTFNSRDFYFLALIERDLSLAEFQTVAGELDTFFTLTG